MDDKSPKDDARAVDNIEDSALVLAAQGGDMAAMNQLLSRHFTTINRLCRRMLGDRGRAEDARGEALFQASRRIATFDGRASFGTWLYLVAKNVCLKDIRSRARTPTVPRDPGSLENDHPYWPHERIATRLDIDAVMAPITPVYRDALVCWFYADMSYADIAAWLGIELNTVKTRLLRGKEQLKQLLSEPDAPPTLSNTATPAHSAAPRPALGKSRR